jgi:hypothetical protein
MYLLGIHIEYVLVHDLIRWDLTWPQSISPMNQSSATRKDASDCVGAARAALVARGRREPCRGRSWASRGHTGRAAHEGSSAMLGTRGEPAGEDAIGPPRKPEAVRAGRESPHWPRQAAGGREPALRGCIHTPPGQGRAGRAGSPCRQATPSHRASCTARAPGRGGSVETGYRARRGCAPGT